MSSLLRLALPAAGFLAVMTACSEQGIRGIPPEVSEPNPEIEVTPLELVFGTLRDGETNVQRFNVANIGEGVLTVDDIAVEGSDSYAILSNRSFVLDPGAAVDIEVQFTPLAANDIFAQAVVFSDDFDEPAVPVDLVGVGAVPELTITPSPYDFGQAFIPCDQDVLLTLSNTGTDALTIDGLNYITDGQMTAYTDGLVFPVVLQPGQYAQMAVGYVPRQVGQTQGTLEVYSNDPRRTVQAVQKGEGVYAAQQTDTHIVPGDPPVDILIAVDQSCSMDDDAQRLGANFATFINTLQTVTTGWQVGVVTEDSGCFNSGILHAGVPNYIQLFQNAVVQGVGGTWTEALLKLADVAVGKTGNGQCNAGFLRPNAMLHVILVSDEPYQGPSTWSAFVSSWEALKGNPSLVKVSSIVDLSGCGGQGNGGYLAPAQSTGGLSIDLCDPNWAANYTDDLALASLTAAANFSLSGQAAASTITVSVNGQVWPSGWTYNAGSNSVSFTTPPAEGATVDITYGVLPVCN